MAAIVQAEGLHAAARGDGGGVVSSARDLDERTRVARGRVGRDERERGDVTSAAQLAGVAHRGRPVAAAAGAVVASGGVEVADVGDEGGVAGGGGPDDGLVRGDALDRRGGHGPRVRGATHAIATDAPRHGARAYGRRGGEVRVRVRVRGSRIEGRRGG